MKASIVIPNLNGAGWLRDSIESIWAQMEQDFELIIIDNGSTDESLAIAGELRDYASMGIAYEDMAVLYRTNLGPRLLIEN